jgi:hypothetical protein
MSIIAPGGIFGIQYNEGVWTPSTPSVTAGPTPGAGASYTGQFTRIGNIIKAKVTLDFDDSGTNVAVDDRFAVGGLEGIPNSTAYTASGNFWIYSSFGGGNNAFGTIGTATAGNTAAFYVTHIDGTLNYGSVLIGEFWYMVS